MEKFTMGWNQIMNFSMVSYHSYRKRYTLHINVKSARYQCRHSSGWNIEFTIFYLWGFLSSLPLTTASTKDRNPNADMPPPSSEHSSAPGLAMNITGAGFFFLNYRYYNVSLWAICYHVHTNQSLLKQSIRTIVSCYYYIYTVVDRGTIVCKIMK